MSGGENDNKQMTTRERQQIEVAKLEAELNALKVDAAKVRSANLDALCRAKISLSFRFLRVFSF